MFEVIPAIDLLEGKVVRLNRGDFKDKIVYFDNPLEAAQKLEAEGAKRIHIVDLDGARTGTPKNLEIIKKIVEQIKIPVQLGGGVRRYEQIDELLGFGVDRIILGTSAIYNPNLLEKICKEFGNKIIVSIDAKNNKVAAKGWREISSVNIITFAKEAIGMGVKRFIYTDILKDGTLEGPNLEGVKNFASGVNIPVLTAGGISSKEDIEKLRDMNILEGCIIGKAIYSGDVKLSELLLEPSL